MEIFGLRILGWNAESGRKLLLTLLVIAAALAVRALLYVARKLHRTQASRRLVWFRKSIRLTVGALAILFILSIWFEDPTDLAVFGGLVAGGLAFASQNLLLSVAGYFVIVFGKAYDLGDRIEMGGVRGDVLDIGLFRTTIMEMGVPARMLPNPNHWVSGRQFTGRIVTVVNAEIFKQPVCNYTQSFPFIWEEVRVPVRYGVNLVEAERIILDATREATAGYMAEAQRELQRLASRFVIHPSDLEPRVYVRLTTTWVELVARFVVREHGTRAVRDQISRRILQQFAAQGLEIAPPMVEVQRSHHDRAHEAPIVDVGAAAAQREQDEESPIH